MTTFVNLLDDAALLSLEHQLHLEELLGEHSWQADLNELYLAFTGDHPLSCTNIHLLGSAAPGPSSWLWIWANPGNFPEKLTELANSVRQFGEQHGIAELSTAEIPFDALPEANGDPNQVAIRLATAAKVISGRWTSYTFNAGGGTRLAFLIEHPEFQLPAPQPTRIMRVIQQGLEQTPLNDHRRALYSYAIQRSIKAEFNADQSQLTLVSLGYEATIDFNEHGFATNISASMGDT